MATSDTKLYLGRSSEVDSKEASGSGMGINREELEI